MIATTKSTHEHYKDLWSILDWIILNPRKAVQDNTPAVYESNMSMKQAKYGLSKMLRDIDI